MAIPWPNSEFTKTYDPPIIYLWTLQHSQSIWESCSPAGYAISWVVNIFLFLVELIAWMVGGDFFVLWATIATWGGLMLGALPWIFEILYIFVEYPAR